jgi:lipoprotein-anchoring transpeptidase ErfK/SrfK
MCSVPYKPYQAPKNARKITLIALGAAVVIITGLFVAKSYLNRNKVQQVPETTPPGLGPVVDSNTPAVPVNADTNSTAQSSQVSSVSSEIDNLVSQGQADIASGDVVKARDEFNDALRMLEGKPEQAKLKEQLADLSQVWLFTKDVVKGDSLCEIYTVKPGDKLTSIAAKYKIPYELVMELNNITKASSLRSGQKLKVVNGPFHAIVSRSNFLLDIYLQNTYVRSFKCGMGKEGRETPTGLWRVASGGKMIKPRWTDPDTGRVYLGTDKDYPLGARWIALDGLEGNTKGRVGFAIHGTNEPVTVGTKSSRGCIRLHDGDVIQVYNMLVPSYSEGRVIE